MGITTSKEPSVLIVGAGPTGLLLALRLHRHGIPLRIIEQHDGSGRQSRALVVHARTLEFYQQLGLAERLVAQGTIVDTVRLREKGKEIAHFSLRDMGRGLSPFPFALCLPQDEHEQLLIDVLEAEGVRIEWQTMLESLEQGGGAVSTRLVRNGQQEHAQFAYVAGCDGARSRVREALGIAFGGGTYDRLYYVADVKPSGSFSDGFVVALDQADFGLRLPSRKGENERLIGFIPRDAEPHPTFEAARASAERLLGLSVAHTNWFSTYRVHHRVAGRFRTGRCFLLGDAGHVHSPVGGQGMNTGLGDAVNLSWKLAHVLQGRANDDLLQSYETERIAFARSLVATTDKVFQIITNDGILGRAFRTWIMPHVVPTVAGFDVGRRTIFRLVSQIRISYPDSPLSEGSAGKLAGGDRLPWVEDSDNFASLTALEWAVHVYGTAGALLEETCRRLGVALIVRPWSDGAQSAGLVRDAAYLVRPDAHIAIIARSAVGEDLEAYAKRLGLRLAPADGEAKA